MNAGLRWCIRAAVALSALWGSAAVAAEVSVAVAASLAAPMKRLAAEFERRSGHRVVAALGATGALHAQVLHGAPFEVFLSADHITVGRLIQDGRALADSRITLATGRLVLWSAQPGLVDAQGDILRSSRFERLAVANPKLAPYGAAAREVIDRLGLGEHLRPRLVQAENMAQAQQFTASGNAQLGFLALSQVMRDGHLTGGSAWLVPSFLHAPLRHEAVLLQRGADSQAARAFLVFLRSDAARAIIRAHGYED